MVYKYIGNTKILDLVKQVVNEIDVLHIIGMFSDEEYETLITIIDNGANCYNIEIESTEYNLRQKLKKQQEEELEQKVIEELTLKA